MMPRRNAIVTVYVRALASSLDKMLFIYALMVSSDMESSLAMALFDWPAVSAHLQWRFGDLCGDLRGNTIWRSRMGLPDGSWTSQVLLSLW
jgi:hypothetical protein